MVGDSVCAAAESYMRSVMSRAARQQEVHRHVSRAMSEKLRVMPTKNVPWLYNQILPVPRHTRVLHELPERSTAEKCHDESRHVCGEYAKV